MRKGLHEIRDCQNIVASLVDPFGEDKTDHWTHAASDTLVWLILHVLYAEKDKSLTGVLNLISSPHRSETEIFSSLLTALHDPTFEQGWQDFMTNQPTHTHPLVAAGARDMLHRSDGERSGILSTVKIALKLYRDPIIAKNTATSDFTLQDMVYHDKPVSLYLIIPPGDITRTMPLLRLILNQLLARLTEKCDSHEMSKKRHPLKLLLDEFPQFGRMEFIEKGLAYLAGYHISAYLIAQDLTQVYKAYGAQQSIIANCAVRVAYAPNTYETAKHLSELLGTKTVVKEQKHFSGHRWDWQLKHMAVGEHETKRAS